MSVNMHTKCERVPCITLHVYTRVQALSGELATTVYSRRLQVAYHEPPGLASSSVYFALLK